MDEEGDEEQVEDRREEEVARLAYRPAELAGRVGLSCKAIYRAIDRGELRAARVAAGSRLLIPVEEADAWLADNLIEQNCSPSVPPSPRRAIRRRGQLRPLGDAIAELDLPPAPGYDQQAS